MTQQAKTHVLAHTHEHGTTRYQFIPPEGFDVPYGTFEGVGTDGTDDPELMALIAYLEVDYEPEKAGEMIDVAVMDETIEEPTLGELQKLMTVESQESKSLPEGLLANLDKTQLSNLSDLIRSGMDNADGNILNLKPHEREAEGYIQADVDDANAKFALGNALLEDIAALMNSRD
jgi:hypothetical protein